MSVATIEPPKLLLIRFFGLRAFFFHFPENLTHVLDFFPDRATALVPPWDVSVAGSG